MTSTSTAIPMHKHKLFNNVCFNKLLDNQRDILVRNAVLYHFEIHNNQQMLDGLGCFAGFVMKYVPFNEYVCRIRLVVGAANAAVTKQLGGFRVDKLKSSKQPEIPLSIPKNDRNTITRDLQNFCEMFFTQCFNDILYEIQQSAQAAKDEAAAFEKARREQADLEAAEKAAEKAKIKAEQEAEQQVTDNIHAVLAQFSEEDWE